MTTLLCQLLPFEDITFMVCVVQKSDTWNPFGWFHFFSNVGKNFFASIYEAAKTIYAMMEKRRRDAETFPGRGPKTMPLRELQETELIQLSEADIGRAAVLFTTPMCGTCKVAERMLEVAEAVGIDYPLSKININFAPRLREEWRIASVPCLVILKNGKILRQEYAMRSVDYLYALLKD